MVPAPSEEILIQFAGYLATTGKGYIKEKLSARSCVASMERFFAGFTRKTRTEIEPKVRKAVTNVSIISVSFQPTHAEFFRSTSIISSYRPAMYLLPKGQSTSFQQTNTNATYMLCGPTRRTTANIHVKYAITISCWALSQHSALE